MAGSFQKRSHHFSTARQVLACQSLQRDGGFLPVTSQQRPEGIGNKVSQVPFCLGISLAPTGQAPYADVIKKREVHVNSSEQQTTIETGTAFFLQKDWNDARQKQRGGGAEMREQRIILLGVEETAWRVQAVIVTCCVCALLMCQSDRSRLHDNSFGSITEKRHLYSTRSHPGLELPSGLHKYYVSWAYMLRQSSRTRRKFFRNGRA